MGILDSFERSLERAVNGAFAKTFRSGVQPVELVSSLRKELDTKAAVVSRDRILAPNSFTVSLSPTDYDRMRALGPALVDELEGAVRSHAKRQHYQFAGALQIELIRSTALTTGIVEVASVTDQAEVAWAPAVDVAGERHQLEHARTVIGRGSEADITVADNGISRRHLEIGWDGRRAQVRDLGSTNGSKLNGRPLTQPTPLNPGDTITLGRTTVIFNVVPVAKRAVR